MTKEDVRALRQQLNLTQGAFAKLLGTNAKRVYLWEHNGPSPGGILKMQALKAQNSKLKPAPTAKELATEVGHALALQDVGAALQLLKMLQEKLCGD